MGNNKYPKYAEGYTNTISTPEFTQSPTSVNGTPKSKWNPLREQSEHSMRKNKQRNLHRQINRSRNEMFDFHNLPNLDEYDTIIYGKKTFGTPKHQKPRSGKDLEKFTFNKEKRDKNYQLVKQLVNLTAENIDQNYVYGLALKGVLKQVMNKYKNTEHSEIAEKTLIKIGGKFHTTTAMRMLAKEILPAERKQFKSNHSCSYILTETGEKVNRQYFSNKRDPEHSDFGEHLSQDKLEVIGHDLQEISLSTGGTGCTITTDASKLPDFSKPNRNVRKNDYDNGPIDSSTDQEDNDYSLNHISDLTRDERDWIERDAPVCKRRKASRLTLDEEGYPKSFYE